MEPITKADVKDLLAELRSGVMESITEAFGTYKPAVDAQTSGRQVSVDLLQQHDYHVKGNGTEETPAADPLDPLALKEGTTLPTTTGDGDAIDVLAAAVASEETFDEEANKDAASATPTPTTAVTPFTSDTATPAIVETGPKVILRASIGFITTTPTTCSTEGVRHNTTTTNIIHVLAAPAASGDTLDGHAIDGVVSTHTTCLMVCLSRHPVDAPVLVVPLATTLNVWCITSKVSVLRPIPWPSFMEVHVDGVEARPLPWPSFGKINGCEFRSVAVEKASWRCFSDSSPATLCDITKFSNTYFSELKELVLNLMSSSNFVRCDEWVLSPWDPGQADVSDFTKVFYSQAIFHIYLKKLMLQSMVVSGSNGFVSLLVLVQWSIGTCYLAGISNQEKKISYVVVLEEYYETKIISERQKKEFTLIKVATWSGLGVLIQFSWYALNSWAPLLLMIYKHLLLPEHASMRVKLTLDGILLDLQDGSMDITKCNITACFRYMILVYRPVATHLAVHSNCPTDCQLDLGTNSPWYPDSKHFMLVVSKCAFINMKLLPQSDDIHLQMWPLHIFPPEDEFIFSVGILVQLILRNECHWWNCTKDQWTYLPVCAILDVDLSRPAVCEAWLHNHQDMMQMQTGFSMQMNVTCSVQPSLLLTHGYQLSIMAPTMLSFAWENLDCIFNSRTARCALQVTSEGLFVFILAFGGLQGKLQGGRHTSVLDQHKELQLPWDPGGRVAAWGQAELQGGRGVSDLPVHSTWAGVWTAIWAGPIYRQTLTREQHYKYKALQLGRHLELDQANGTVGSFLPTSALISHSPSCLFILYPDPPPNTCNTC